MIDGFNSSVSMSMSAQNDMCIEWSMLIKDEVAIITATLLNHLSPHFFFSLENFNPNWIFI